MHHHDLTGNEAVYDPANDDRVLSQTDTTGGRTVTDPAMGNEVKSWAKETLTPKS